MDMVKRKMPGRESLVVFGVTPRSALLSLILVSNALTWYSLAFNVLTVTMTEISMAIHFSGAIVAALVGAKVIEKFTTRRKFLVLWMLLGVLSSLFLIHPNFPNSIISFVSSLIIGVAFGLGLPASLGYFTDSTNIENRAKLGGLTLIVNGLSTFLLTMIPLGNVLLVAIILMIWRTAALIIFLVVNCPTDNIVKQKGISYGSILNQQTFVLFVIPWLMFSLVNFLSVPIQMHILDETTIETYVMIEVALAGIFAVVAGFLSDIIGRKRVTISGFVLLGIGYAILGISQGILGIPGDNPLIWFLYTVVDGVAWGIFSVIFIMTIWGDLSYGASCEKYYALGGIPFFISNFLRILVGPLITSGTNSQMTGAAIFSLTAFFMFLAVLPLMFAPETLPEKKIKDRELKKYISAAQKAKKKYA